MKGKLPVSDLCEITGVSRSGYYKWLKGRRNPDKRKAQHQELIRLVMAIHTRFPSFGYRFIKDRIMRETGWLVSRTRVLNAMQELGVQSVVRKKSYIPGKEHDLYPNHLGRNFRAYRPMEKVVTDITYLYVKNLPYYLSVYLDLYNNEILDYALGERNNLEIVLPPLQRILKKRKKDVYTYPITVHSDQGNQYKSYAYASTCRQADAIISMSRKGTPLDNAPCESFWGWFKGELFAMYPINSFTDLQRAIDEHVFFHNNHRPQSRLRYLSPVQFREGGF